MTDKPRNQPRFVLQARMDTSDPAHPKGVVDVLDILRKAAGTGTDPLIVASFDSWAEAKDAANTMNTEFWERNP